jgi:hypothetical protein
MLATVSRAEDVSPEETVERFLVAMQSRRFGDAYDLVSKGMKVDAKIGSIRTYRDLTCRRQQSRERWH